MASEIRVNTINNRSGLGTITVADTGVTVSGVVTAASGFSGALTGNVTGNVTGNITGNLTGTASTATNALGITTTIITIGNSFIKSNHIGVGSVTASERDSLTGIATGSLVYNTTYNALQVYTGSAWETVGDQTTVITATGGNTVDTSSRPGYKVHIFTGPGTFAVSGGFNDVEYLVVAGGGGAGGDVGGGAGAGGYRTGTFAVSPGNYPVFVGGGGSGHPFNSPGTNGVPSYFGSIVSEGGGFGTRSGSSSPGGSGGGTPYNNSNGWGYGINPSTPQPVLDPYSLTAPYPVTQGNPGGSNAGGGSGGGGGGGAGAAGSNGTGPPQAAVGGAGGAGLPSSITGSPVTRGGGGAGAGYQAPGASGGAGGGGPSGGGSPGNPGSAGSANTGGGGGSGSSTGGGAGGGSGIVIIAYPTA